MNFLDAALSGLMFRRVGSGQFLKWAANGRLVYQNNQAADVEVTRSNIDAGDWETEEPKVQIKKSEFFAKVAEVQKVTRHEAPVVSQTPIEEWNIRNDGAQDLARKLGLQP